METGKISIIIPSRNEPYLNKTINSLLENAEGNIEIIVILDGCDADLPKDPRVKSIRRMEARGMRNGINSAVAISKGEYLLKIDAHCMVDKGYDVKLITELQDNWVMVPRRKRLDPGKWEIIQDGRPDIDYETLDENLQGKKDDKRGSERKDILIDDLMTFQGSCWCMKKTYFHELELMNESEYGPFFHEAQEICLKAWLSGGRVVVNKNTWYAHWHKDKRGYTMPEGAKEQARAFMEQWKDKGWHKQIYPLTYLFDKFNGN